MLIEVPLDRIRKLCSLLEKEWPRSMEAINHLRRYHSCKKEDAENEITLLYPGGNEDSGVFVHAYLEASYHLIINFYAIDNRELTLKHELLTWNFTWPENVLFDFTLPKYIPLEDEIMKTKGYTLIERVKLKYFALTIENALKFDTQLPHDVEFGPLPWGYHELNAAWWSDGEDESRETMQEWYDGNKNFAVALLSKTTGVLLSSCARTHDGKIGAILTRRSARGMGYGAMLVRKVSKMLAEDSIQPGWIVGEHNQDMLGIISKLGFRYVLDGFRSSYRKSDESATD